MHTIVRAALGAALLAVGVAGGGTVYASQSWSAPAVGAVVATPAAAGWPALLQPATTAPADAIRAARAAVAEIAVADARKAAAATRPRYTCEPAADARVVDNVIVNKNCPALIAAKERAQCEYAESGGARYDVDGPGAGEIASRNALQACREQTGMTTEQCKADAAAGNAS